MSYKIYVGNYPLNFMEDDVLNLFQDYDGVEMQGFFRNKSKCYSFLYCTNEHQLIEIVSNLNDIDVCGRNLIVRAADENLQKQIMKCISKSGEIHPKNTCDVNSSTSVYGNNGIFRQSEVTSKYSSPQMLSSYGKNAYSRKCEMESSAVYSEKSKSQGNSKTAKKNENIYNDYSPNSSKSFPQNSQYAQNSFGDSREKNTSCFYQNTIESQREKPDLNIIPQETFSRFSKSKTDSYGHYKTINERFDSYKRNLMHKREELLSTDFQSTDLSPEYQTRNRNVSESSLETAHNQPSSQEFESLSFVSVINFPLYMPIRSLYNLFADFNPIKVFIVCNEPRKDKTPTEAIIAFENEKEATDAILTLDNTIYRGRILIVTDAVDKSLVSELLSFR